LVLNKKKRNLHELDQIAHPKEKCKLGYVRVDYFTANRPHLQRCRCASALRKNTAYGQIVISTELSHANGIVRMEHSSSTSPPDSPKSGAEVGLFCNFAIPAGSACFCPQEMQTGPDELNSLLVRPRKYPVAAYQL